MQGGMLMIMLSLLFMTMRPQMIGPMRRDWPTCAVAPGAQLAVRRLGGSGLVSQAALVCASKRLRLIEDFVEQNAGTFLR